MSDWQIPDDLADNLRRANYVDAWAREIEHTKAMRAILTDLITELRDLHPVKKDYCLPCTRWGAVNAWAPEHWTGSDNWCPSLLAIDRAERRLREMQNE